MAAPEYVPVPPAQEVRVYGSPPRRPEPWCTDRPADLRGIQPRGDRLGSPGPDQGYLLTLTPRFAGKLKLTPGEHERDALAGGVVVALKRASLFSRAPVIHDLRVGLTVWGFLSEAPPELVALRKPLFEEVAHPHYYVDQRRIADMVPEATLRMTPDQVAEAHARDWRSLLDLS